MSSFDLSSLNSMLESSEEILCGVNFSEKSLKLDTAEDAQPIVDAINECPNLQYLALMGNTLGVMAAEAIAKALGAHPELKICYFSDIFAGRLMTEIAPALDALFEGMIEAGARLTFLNLSDNAFGSIVMEGFTKLLQSDVCSELEVLHLNNNGLGSMGGYMLALALLVSSRRLKIFTSGGNRLENDGAVALAAAFKVMGTLEAVAMPQNGIHHPGIVALFNAFQHNPFLSIVDLNNNKFGLKGALTVVDAMPKLNNLKSIDLGNCLIRSKGAEALATAFKENELLIESIDLSCNGIGHEACMKVVDALTVLPDSQKRLTRIVLAGNSLGNEEHKSLMRNKMGACAELSGDEDSDEEFVTDSENSDVDSEADLSGNLYDVVVVPEYTIVGEIQPGVVMFLEEPSLEYLKKLGPSAAQLIHRHLLAIENPEQLVTAYVEAVMLVCGTGETYIPICVYPYLITATTAKPYMLWVLIENMLRSLALLKSEDKNYQIRWSLPECYSVLARVIDLYYFPQTLRDTLRFFISCKLDTLPPEVKEIIEKHPSLHQKS